MVSSSNTVPFAGLLDVTSTSKTSMSKTSSTSSTSKTTTLHTSTSPSTSRSTSSSSFNAFAALTSAPFGGGSASISPSSVSKFAAMTNGGYNSGSSSSLSSANPFGAQTNWGYNPGTSTGTGTVDSMTTVPPYTIVTQNGGICIMSYTGTSPVITPSYVSYVAQTTPEIAIKARLNSGTAYTQPYASITEIPDSSTSGTSAPCNDCSIPITDVPVCADVSETPWPTLASEPQTTRAANSANGSLDDQQPGLSTGQRAGIAVGVVLAVILILVATVWYIRRRGMSRVTTGAQRNMWGWDGEGGAFGPHNTVGGRNADVAEAGYMVSGLGLREAIIGPAGARGFRSA